MTKKEQSNVAWHLWYQLMNANDQLFEMPNLLFECTTLLDDHENAYLVELYTKIFDDKEFKAASDTISSYCKKMKELCDKYERESE